MVSAEILELVYILSEGDTGAADLILGLFKSENGCVQLKVCDDLDIRRSKIIYAL